MKILWRPAAIADLQNTLKYIKHNLKNPSAANALREKVFNGVMLLTENPYMGMSLKSRFELDKDVSYRYIIIKKQIVFYEIFADRIEIIRVLDGRTDYMSVLFSQD